MRKAIFWLHLAVGLLAGSVVLLMAVTGLMLAFEPQIIAAAERGAYRVTPTGSRMAPSATLAKVRAGVPDAAPVGITLRREPDAAAAVSLGRDRTVFVDPYTGRIVGEGGRLRPFLHQVEQFHRNLTLGETGKRITGASTLAFVALIVTGLYLWVPRQWAKVIVFPKLGLRGKARDFNWHNSLGLLAALPLTVLALTGIVMNYEWANRLLFRVAGSEPPPPRKAAASKREAQPGRPERAVDFTRIDELWSAVETAHENWQSISLRAQDPRAPANILVDWGNGHRPDRRVLLTADLATGRIIRTESYDANSLGRKARLWIRPIHTGAAGGVLGQAAAALAASAAALLVWTGFALAWRRFRIKAPLRTFPADRSRAPSREAAPVAAGD